ncbi:MAG: hypothetical protein K6E17_08000 [Clostridiales bacterium]|nr:hypothetical protein [Clostridiales bacterium]
MKKRFIRILAVLCAALLAAGAALACAAAEEPPATPTDMAPVPEEGIPEEPADETQEEPQPGPQPEDQPEEQPEPEPEPEAQEEPAPQEEPADNAEQIITGVFTVGDSWEGKMSRTKFAVLKLDLPAAQRVSLLVEGRNVWAAVEKADRPTEEPVRNETDPETGRAVIRWEAEAGSYLITLGPAEPNLMSKAAVTFMDDAAYEAWAAAEGAETDETPEAAPEEEPEAAPEEEPEAAPETAPETDPETEPGGEEPDAPAEPEEAAQAGENDLPDENRPESETPAEEEKPTLPDNRDAEITIRWDEDKPYYGSVAHFHASLTGYENLDYTLQWQWSVDRIVWNDVEGATAEDMDVVYTAENGAYRWRIMVYIILPDEE